MGTSDEKELKMSEPLIHVGILQRQKVIGFSLLSTYKLQGKEFPPGEYEVRIKDGNLLFNGEEYTEPSNVVLLYLPSPSYRISTR